jgi:hypothetical protein
LYSIPDGDSKGDGDNDCVDNDCVDNCDGDGGGGGCDSDGGGVRVTVEGADDTVSFGQCRT